MCENFNRVFVYMLREFLKQTDPKTIRGVSKERMLIQKKTNPITDGDSLENYWFTPMYFSDFWCTRRIIRRMQDILESDPK